MTEVTEVQKQQLGHIAHYAQTMRPDVQSLVVDLARVRGWDQAEAERLAEMTLAPFYQAMLDGMPHEEALPYAIAVAQQDLVYELAADMDASQARELFKRITDMQKQGATPADLAAVARASLAFEAALAAGEEPVEAFDRGFAAAAQ
ncbi:MAG: hypothetical protein KDJ36_00420 [Hyphomicrobiaceae bacterium]|nr:hypothetical protein [Hyphomicrobiaceae bacterium]